MHRSFSIRVRFLPSISALAALLLLLLVSTFASAADGPALTDYIPSSAKGVLHIDIAKLRAAGALDTMMKSTGADQKLTTVSKKMEVVDFDPMTQVNRALVVVDSFDQKTQPLLIFEGDLPKDKIIKALTEEKAATQSSVGSVTVYTRGTRGSLTFLTSNIGVIGPTNMVNEVAAIAAGTKKSSPPSAIRRGIGKVKKSRNLWFAAQLPAQYLDKSPLKGASLVYGDADIASDLLLNAHAVMPSQDAANTAAKQAQDQLKTIGERDEVAALGLAPVIQAVSIVAKGDTVDTSLKLSQGRFRRLLVTAATIIRDELR